MLKNLCLQTVQFSALCRSGSDVGTKQWLSLVFHSVFVTLGLGKPLACASLLPAREKEANEAENLSWKHQEELLPASIVG